MLTSSVGNVNGTQQKGQANDTQSIEQRIQQLQKQIRDLKSNEKISPEEREKRIKNLEEQIERLEEQKQKMEKQERNKDIDAKEVEKQEILDKPHDGALDLFV